MAQRLRASIPLPRRTTIHSTFNDVLTEENYDRTHTKQMWRRSVVPGIHRVETHAGLEVDGVQWQCGSYDGCVCSCMQWTVARDEALLLAVRAEGSAAWHYRAPHNFTAHENAWRRIALRLRRDPSFEQIFRTAQEPGLQRGTAARGAQARSCRGPVGRLAGQELHPGRSTTQTPRDDRRADRPPTARSCKARSGRGVPPAASAARRRASVARVGLARGHVVGAWRLPAPGAFVLREAAQRQSAERAQRRGDFQMLLPANKSIRLIKR